MRTLTVSSGQVVSQRLIAVWLMLLNMWVCPGATADDKPIKELILPGEAFLVEGRPAFVFLPPVEKRSTHQPWIMYSPTLPGLPDAHEKWMHEQYKKEETRLE